MFFLADIDPELIRKLSCSKYDVASSGDRVEHKPLAIDWTRVN